MVVAGILLRDLEADVADIGEGRGERDAGFEAGNAKEIVAAAGFLAWTVGALGGPEVSGLSGSEVEIAREDTNDGGGLVVEDDGLSEDAGACGETALPGGVADEGDSGGRELAVGGAEIAAEDGGDAESAEEPGRDAGAVGRLWAVRGSQHEAVGSIGIEGLEDGVAALVIEVVEPGKVKVRAERVGFVKDDEAGGVLVGQGSDEGRVDEAEDSNAGGDAEGEDENGGQGKAGVFAQLTQGEAKVLPKGFGGGFPADGPDFVADGFSAAHFGAGGAQGLLAGHTAADFFFDGGVEEGLQLGLDFGVALVAAEEGADSTDHVSEHGDLFS